MAVTSILVRWVVAGAVVPGVVPLAEVGVVDLPGEEVAASVVSEAVPSVVAAPPAAGKK